MNIMYNGSIFGREALCYQGRQIIQQLKRLGHTISIDGPKVEGYWSEFYDNFKREEADVYLMNGHPHILPKIAAKGHKKIISITVFETIIPKEWVDSINIPEVVEVWTVSEFCKKLLKKSGIEKPIKVIYLGFDKRFKKTKTNLFPKDESFKFLHVSAPHCIGMRDRKGLDVLLRAFKEEFGDDKKVLLILKINSIYADRYNRLLQRKGFSIQKYLGSLISCDQSFSNIALITDYYKTEQLNSLYNSIDCGVFPSRGEGFGLPQLEIGLIGKPVITSDYGATNEFSDPRLRVSIESKTPLDYNIYPYNTELFANPSVSSLRKLLRTVYANYSEEKLLALKHSKKLKFFSWNRVGERMDKFLSKPSIN